MSATLPSLDAVNKLFTMLFGQGTICKASQTPLGPEACAVVACYRDNNGTTKRLLTCDLAFANSAGAALSMIPPAAANDATKAGHVPDNILANLSEVLNIAINLFTDSFGGRLELAGVSRLSDLPPEAKSALTAKDRATVEVLIPRYAAGQVGLIAV